MNKLIIFLLAFTGCTDYKSLAKEHNRYCVQHNGRKYTLVQDGHTWIFCYDGKVIKLK